MSHEIKLEWGAAVPENATLTQAVNAEAKSDLALSALNESDRLAVAEFVKRIDLNDSTAVSAYGADSQNKVAGFSDSVLKTIRTKDAGDAGRLLTNLVTELRGFSGDEEKKTGLSKMFGGTKKSLAKMSAGYAKVETNVDAIASALEGQRRVLMKDVAMLDEMYDNNYNYYRELTMYIIAGKEKARQFEAEVIPELKRQAEDGGNVAAQKLSDAQNSLNRFEKKLHDLSLSRMISIQMAPQIRLIQGNDTQLIDKMQSSIVNAIPLWKNQIVIALSLANAQSALTAQRKVSDTTNELLKKNAEMLKQGTLGIAEESERSLISIETIEKTNADLIETINGVIDIQKRGRESRAEAENRLVTMENEFKQALLSAGRPK